MKRITRRESHRRRKPLSKELRDYIAKTDRYRAGRDPMTLMRGAPARLARAVKGLSGATLRRRPAPGKWCIQEILGHLVDTEVVYGYRYRMANMQPGSPIQGYDQEQWVREANYRGRKWSATKLLAQVADLRRATLYYLESMPRGSATKRYGMHTERGKETVRRIQELIAGHDINHLEQIRAIRKKFGR